MGNKAKYDKEIYEAIKTHWSIKTMPPTIQYITENCGLLSKSNVWLALRRLKAKGYIKIIDSKAIPVTLANIIEGAFNESRIG